MPLFIYFFYGGNILFSLYIQNMMWLLPNRLMNNLYNLFWIFQKIQLICSFHTYYFYPTSYTRGQMLLMLSAHFFPFLLDLFECTCPFFLPESHKIKLKRIMTIIIMNAHHFDDVFSLSRFYT